MSDAPASSLTILGGPLDGTKLVLDQAVDEVLIGSDADCRLCIDLPGVSPIHARLWVDMNGVTVHDTRSPRGVYVNDDAVGGQAPVRDGDVLWLGPPGDPDSVMIQCRFAPISAPVIAPAPGGEFVAEEPVLEVAPEPATAEDAAFFVDEAAEPAPIPLSPVGVDEFVFESEAPGGPPPAPAPEADVVLFDEAPAQATEDAPVVEAQPEFELEAPHEAPPTVVGGLPEQTPPEFELEAAHEAPPTVVGGPPEEAPPGPELPGTAVPPPVAPAPPVPRAAVPPSLPAKAALPPTPPAEDVFVVDDAAVAAAGPPPAKPAPPAPAAPKPAAPAAPRPAPSPAPRPAAAQKAGPGAARYAPIAVGVLLLVGGGGWAALHFMSAPQLDGVSPGRARVGEAITLSGKNFSPNAGENAVDLGGKPARVVQASATQLKVEVPAIGTTPGKDVSAPVVVKVKGRETKAGSIAIYQAPRIHGITPEVGMPGDEVVLAGSGWSAGAQVKFGGLAAEVVETTPSALKVKVPAVEGAPGTSVDVTVAMGADPSNAASFLVGRLPLVKGVEPRSAAMGDVLTVSGRGFHATASENDVRFGSTPALVTSAAEAELKVAVPWLPAGGDVALEVRVPGSEHVGQATVAVAAPAEAVEFRFAAWPVEGEPDLAAVGTALGPAFVLAASGGKSASARAAETARRLNEAAGPLKASREADIAVKGIEASPSLVLAGKSDPIVEVTAEDAAAYNSRQGGKGPPVTQARLAVWWEALARDLVLMLVRGEKPQRAASLAAADSRPLADLFAAAQKTGSFGVPRSVLAGAKPPLVAAIHGLGLRVPASVPQPAGAAPAAGEPALPPIPLDRTWTGTEIAGGVKKFIEVAFRGQGGTITYQGGISMSTPLSSMAASKAGVRFTVPARGKTVYYSGKWDGTRLLGEISSDPSGKGDLGTFELLPR